VPIGVPTPRELSHHYLWRFYKKMPKDGHIALFDRSWYGRVLIERVEQLIPVVAWQRAYREINEFETHMANHGTIILKFWLHIDPDEQLSRFNARINEPLKNHKITDADWRNRDNWPLYEAAANEMLAHTHTPHAPWTVIESNHKKFARIKVLKIVTETLEEAMKA
jgi:polyphosphate kinase 2 (PPK2 family)